MMQRNMHSVFTVLFLTLFAVNGVTAATTDSLLIELKKTVHDTTRVGTLNALAKQYRTTDINKAVEYAKEAYSISLHNNYAYGAASSADLIGSCYVNLGAYKQALRYHFLAVSLFDKIGNKRGLSFSYNNLGAVYSNLKDYARAEAYYLKSLQLKKERNATKEMSSTYINLGNVKMHQDSPYLCIRYYEQGLANAQKHDDQTNITIALMNLGEAYLDIKDNIRALSYYKLAVAQNMALANTYHKGQIYFGLGKIYTNLNNYDKAKWYYLQALGIAKQAGIKPLERHIYKYFSQMFEKANKPTDALTYLKLYQQLDDSLFSEENSKNINEMQAVYEGEQKDRQIELLNKNKEIAEGKLAYEHLYRNIFFVCFVAVLIIMLVLLRNAHLKQRVNKVLVEKNAEIEKQQKEIEYQNKVLMNYNKELMRENVSAKYEVLKTKINPHFLFNSLSALSGLIVTDTALAHTYVTRFAKLYRYILEMGNDQLIDLEDELRFVQEYVALQNYRFKNIELTFAIDATSFLIAPFAIQFLVENAIKHNEISEKSPLVIKIYNANNYIVVENNVKKKTFVEHSTRIGQRNIYERYKELTEQPPVFEEREGSYYAKIPLIEKT